MTINERLKLLRTENDLTQSQLAAMLNIGQTTIAGYEKDHSPNIYSLIAYADFFGCTVDFLVGREQTPLPYTLSAQERELMQTFRKLKAPAKDFAITHLKLLAHSDLNR